MEQLFIDTTWNPAEEKQKTERVEAQLQQSLSIISSLQSTISDFSKLAAVGPVSIGQHPAQVPSQSQSAPSSPSKSENTFSLPILEEKIEAPVPEGDDIQKVELRGDFNLGETWAGYSHPKCASPESFALLQKDDGNYTIINKKPGRGIPPFPPSSILLFFPSSLLFITSCSPLAIFILFRLALAVFLHVFAILIIPYAGNISFSVGNVPQVVIDAQGNMGVGTTTPRSKLHVEGTIKCGQNSFAVLALENLTVVRGGFSCRTAEPKKGPGWQLFTFENGIFEIRFDHPFAKRPSVLAIQNVPQETPSLIALGFVDQAKFGFVKVAAKAEVQFFFF